MGYRPEPVNNLEFELLMYRSLSRIVPPGQIAPLNEAILSPRLSFKVLMPAGDPIGMRKKILCCKESSSVSPAVVRRHNPLPEGLLVCPALSAKSAIDRARI
jgi:hypothetical protein